MRVGLAICREYGQGPSWWAGLPRSDQALLIADYRLRRDAERMARAGAR